MAKDDWGTPPEIFEHYNEIFDFTLDPAASGKNHLTKWFCISPEEYEVMARGDLTLWGDTYKGCVAVDGLKFDWAGERIFLNPPYSDPGPWVQKAATSGALVVALLPCDPSTQWWQHFVLGHCNNPVCRFSESRTYGSRPVQARHVEYFPHRIAFINPEMGQPAKAEARFAPTMVYWWP